MADVLKKAFKARGWFLFGVAVCIGINFMPTPDGLTLHGKYTLGLLLMVIIFFLTEAVPFIATSFLIVIYQVFMGIRTYSEVPKTFMHDAVFFIMGALMVAAVIVKYDIHSRVAVFMMDKLGNNVHKIVFGIVTIAALCSAFMSEHAVSAMMLPIGVGLVVMNGGQNRCPQLAKLLMFAIAYGSMIGAIATPSGGTRNVIMISYLQDFAGVHVGYGQWMLYVFPLTLILIPVVSFVLLKMFKPEVTELHTLDKDPQWKKSMKQPFSTQQKIVSGIFILTILAWVLLGESMGLGQIAILSAVVYIILGLAEWKDYEKINWQVILFYAGIISLGECIRDTGVAIWIANQFSHFIEYAFSITTGAPLIASTSMLTMLLSNSMGAGPTIAVIGPIVLKIGELGGVSPTAIGVSSAVATSFAYIIVAGAPASMIVYGSGFLKAKDFIKVGCIMSLVSILILTFVFIAGYWRILGV